MPFISSGNMKIGKIANISLTPGKSCSGCADSCHKTCYAMKAYRQYPNVRVAWDTNLESARSERAAYFAGVSSFLASYSGNRFRWHVAGDILDDDYLGAMIELAHKYPRISFLAFTKQYHVVARSTVALPENMSLVVSAWPGREFVNPHRLPVAWMQDGGEQRVPADAHECPGSCSECDLCWRLARVGRDVVFHKH